jgi:hypothetical protein
MLPNQEKSFRSRKFGVFCERWVVRRGKIAYAPCTFRLAEAAGSRSKAKGHWHLHTDNLSRQRTRKLPGPLRYLVDLTIKKSAVACGGPLTKGGGGRGKIDETTAKIALAGLRNAATTTTDVYRPGGKKPISLENDNAGVLLEGEHDDDPDGPRVLVKNTVAEITALLKAKRQLQGFDEATAVVDRDTLQKGVRRNRRLAADLSWSRLKEQNTYTDFPSKRRKMIDNAIRKRNWRWVVNLILRATETLPFVTAQRVILGTSTLASFGGLRGVFEKSFPHHSERNLLRRLQKNLPGPL